MRFDSRGLFNSATHTAPIIFKRIEVPSDDVSVEWLVRQGDFHVLLLKLTDVMVRTDQDSQRIIQGITHYLQQHPHTTLVEPLDVVRPLLDRKVTGERIPSRSLRVDGANFSVRTPRHCVLVTPMSADCAFGDILLLPALCKRRASCGSRDSHHMFILTAASHLSTLPAGEWLIQEYVPHDGVMYKVYVIGAATYVVPKRSLPQSVTRSRLPLSFNSADMRLFIADTTAPYANDDYAPDEQETDVAVGVDATFHRAVADVAAIISKTFALELFGFDLIIRRSLTEIDSVSVAVTASSAAATTELYIVDVNYFPSYNKVADFTSKLTALLIDKHIATHERTR